MMKRPLKRFYLSICIKLKRTFDAIRNERLKINPLQAIPFWIGSLLTGLIAVLYTKLFGWAEQAKGFLFHTNTGWFFLVTPICFLIAWWVVSKFAPYARGSGIPQVIAAIELATPKYNSKIKKLLSVPVI